MIVGNAVRLITVRVHYLRCIVSVTKVTCFSYEHFVLADPQSSSQLQFRQCQVFTALHGMKTRSCDEISVRPSVRLSNACIVTNQKKSQSRFLYHAIENLV